MDSDPLCILATDPTQPLFTFHLGGDVDAVKAVPAIPVADVDASVAFYRENFSFEVIHQDEGFAILRGGPVDVHLWLAADQGWTSRKGGSPVVSGAESFLAGTASCRIQVKDVIRLYGRLEPRQIIHPNGSLQDTEWKTREFSVLDLDGNLITLYEVVEVDGPKGE